MITSCKIALVIVFITITNCGFSQLYYHAYFGNLHSHTGNSDGVGNPEEAYRYARDSAHIDFLAVTDHLEQIDPLEWVNQFTAANQATVNGSFVALCGYEWGSPVHGHTNVYNTSTLLFSVGWYYEDWNAFRQWVIDNPPAFCEFNHPGDPSYATTWNNFDYMGGNSDSVFSLMEFQTPQQATDWYEFALTKGWHLSPVWNQDNHSADWGNKDNGRAGVWATQLSKAGIIEGMKSRRTFATTDKNASIWLDISGVSMGETAPRLLNSPVHVHLSDADNEAWTSVELVSQNGIVEFFESSTSDLDTTILISPYTDHWIFARARQADGDYLWSAPVFFTGPINVNINDIKTPDLTLYPNPASDKITFSLPENFPEKIPAVSIYDTKGQKIRDLTGHALNVSGNQVYVTVSDIPEGVYFLYAYYGSYFLSEKLIIIR